MLYEEGVPPARLLAAARRREILPDPLAGIHPQTPQLPVAAHAVYVPLLDERRRHDAVEFVGVFLAVAIALPRQRGGRFVLGEFHHHRPVVKCCHKQLVPDLPRCRHRQPKPKPERLRPVNLPRVRVQRVDRFRMPDDQLLHATGLDECRWTIPRLTRGQAAPHLFAGQLVKAHRGRALATCEADQMPAPHQRMPCESPDWRLYPVLFLEIFLPKHLARLRIQAEQIPLGTERVDPVAIHRGCGAWAGRITDRVTAVVLVHPKFAPGFLVETNHPLRPRNHAAVELVVRVRRALGQLPVHDEHPSIGHRRPGITAPDRHTPIHLWPALGKFLEDARLTPNTVPLNPKPLRPIRRHRRQAKRLAKRQAEKKFF